MGCPVWLLWPRTHVLTAASDEARGKEGAAQPWQMAASDRGRAIRMLMSAESPAEGRKAACACVRLWVTCDVAQAAPSAGLPNGPHSAPIHCRSISISLVRKTGAPQPLSSTGSRSITASAHSTARATLRKVFLLTLQQMMPFAASASAWPARFTPPAPVCHPSTTLREGLIQFPALKHRPASSRGISYLARHMCGGICSAF